MSERKKIAAIITEYRPGSHADVIVTKFLKGIPDRRWTDSTAYRNSVDVCRSVPRKRSEPRVRRSP